MKFTEEKLEQAVIELFKNEGYIHHTGEQIHKEMPDVLLRDDLKQYLLNRYSDEDITLNEIETIIRKLELYPSSTLYDSNKAIMKMGSDGFLLKREDSSRKDLYIQSQREGIKAELKVDLILILAEHGYLPVPKFGA
jgi:type I restriction enzyme R subunit